MNWFQRHLNWSLFFGIILLPFVVNMILGLIFFSAFWSRLAPSISSGTDGFSEDAFMSVLFENMPLIIFAGLVYLALAVFALVVTWWYLGRKARSKWFMLLIVVPGVVGFILQGFDFIGDLLTFVVALVCLITLFRLQNRAIGYGGDFVGEPAADWRPDTGSSSEYYDRQWRELEHRDVSGAKDASVAGGVAPAVTPPEAPVGIPAEAPVSTPPEAHVGTPAEAHASTPAEAPVGTPAEAPAEAKVIGETVRQEALKMPILLDDAGVAIKCSYHPGADAINLCSRCSQYVCSQCNYITGTHPICRNCWHRRGEAPIAGVGTGAGEGAKLSRAEKPKAEEGERLGELIQLYEQAAPIVNTVIKRGADGSPSPPLELMEGLKLRPILEHAQKLPKSDGKELQEAMKEFEQLLLNCIKVAEAAAEFVGSGEEVVPGEAELTRLSLDIATANGLMQGLSQRLASLSQSPGD